MDAEPDCPVVDVALGKRRSSAAERESPRRVRKGRCALELGVQDVQAHVEVLGDVPLGARTDPPGAPIHVAAVGDRRRQAPKPHMQGIARCRCS